MHKPLMRLISCGDLLSSTLMPDGHLLDTGGSDHWKAEASVSMNPFCLGSLGALQYGITAFIREQVIAAAAKITPPGARGAESGW